MHSLSCDNHLPETSEHILAWRSIVGAFFLEKPDCATGEHLLSVGNRQHADDFLDSMELRKNSPDFEIVTFPHPARCRSSHRA
jgi:hypothetical protein